MTPFSESANTDTGVSNQDPSLTVLANIDSLLVEQRGAHHFLQNLSEDLVQAFLQDPVASLRSWGKAPAPAITHIDPLNQTNITAGSIFTGGKSMETASSTELDPFNQSDVGG